MDRWKGKVAVVTGASSGIGAAVAIDLVKSGLFVVGLARRTDRIQKLNDELTSAPGKLYAHKCDVTNEESIKSAFIWVKNKFGGVNILINNSGIVRNTSILDDSDSIEHIKKIFDTNLLGLVIATKCAFDLLQETKDIGHIINISSVLGHHVAVPKVNGHQVESDVPKANVYAASKHGVRATSEVLRQELMVLNRNVRISQISPGMVKTDIFEAGKHEGGDKIFDQIAALRPEDISAAIMYILGTPAHVQIHDIIIKPVGETF